MPEDTEVVYTFKAEDRISGPMKDAQRQLERTSQAMAETETALGKGTATAETATDKGRGAQDQLIATASAADRATEAQQTAILKSVETMAALHGLQSGLSAITGSMNTLGIVDEETFKTLQKVTAGVQLVVGTAEAVKGVVTLFQSLNAVLKTTAIVSTFASIAENPVKGAAIVGAAGLAAGAVGGYMMSSINNSKTTNITVAHESTARQTETLTDAGAWY